MFGFYRKARITDGNFETIMEPINFNFGESMKKFEFDPLVFVRDNEAHDEYESDDDRKVSSKLRGLYPELAHFGNWALREAWAQYSLDIELLHWSESYDKRNLSFLGYCYVSQIDKDSKLWGSQIDMNTFSEFLPWKKGMGWNEFLRNRHQAKR